MAIMSKENESKIISSLITRLESKDGLVRENARVKLVNIGKDAVPSLINMVSSKNDDTRWEAVKALGQIADPSSSPAVIKALEDEVFDVRWLAAEALLNIGTESIPPLLKALFENPNSLFLREGAHHVIRYMMKENNKFDEVLKPVLEALEGPAPRAAVPPAARTALEKLGAKNIT